jgi:glycosyltransferase involved in cell wall biosynthesis
MAMEADPLNRPYDFASMQRHCIIIPSYNSGPLLAETVRSVMTLGLPVIVVIDGSSDDSEIPVLRMTKELTGLYVLLNQVNAGKGGAFLDGLEFASAQGFTHAVAFDSDGQHDVSDIPAFISASLKFPDAMILGVPVFGPEAPASRVNGRRVGNWWTNLETLWGGVNDSLFGFRVYPIEPSIRIMKSLKGGRRFDFDTQLAVRLYWSGVQPLNMPSKVRYRDRKEGGVTHFRYLRDNLLLIWVHTQLTLKAIPMLPRLIRLRARRPLSYH